MQDRKIADRRPLSGANPDIEQASPNDRDTHTGHLP
jgi:hypothetical protein